MANRNHNSQAPNPHPQPDSTLSQRVDTIIDNAKGMGGGPAAHKAEFTHPEKAAVDNTAVRKPHK